MKCVQLTLQLISEMLFAYILLGTYIYDWTHIVLQLGRDKYKFCEKFIEVIWFHP